MGPINLITSYQANNTLESNLINQKQVVQSWKNQQKENDATMEEVIKRINIHGLPGKRLAPNVFSWPDLNHKQSVHYDTPWHKMNNGWNRRESLASEVEQLRKETEEQKDLIEKLNEEATKTTQTCKLTTIKGKTRPYWSFKTKWKGVIAFWRLCKKQEPQLIWRLGRVC